MLSAEEARSYKKNKIISLWLNDIQYEIEHVIETNNKKITSTHIMLKAHQNNIYYVKEVIQILNELKYMIFDYKEESFDNVDFWIEFDISWAW